MDALTERGAPGHVNEQEPSITDNHVEALATLQTGNLSYELSRCNIVLLHVVPLVYVQLSKTVHFSYNGTAEGIEALNFQGA